MISHTKLRKDTDINVASVTCMQLQILCIMKDTDRLQLQLHVVLQRNLSIYTTTPMWNKTTNHVCKFGKPEPRARHVYQYNNKCGGREILLRSGAFLYRYHDDIHAVSEVTCTLLAACGYNQQYLNLSSCSSRFTACHVTGHH